MLQQGRQLPAATGQLFRLEVPLECVVSLVANLGAGTLGEFHMGGFLCGFPSKHPLTPEKGTLST